MLNGKVIQAPRPAAAGRGDDAPRREPAVAPGAPRPRTEGDLLNEILNNPNLPSPPSVALQIVELVSDCDTDVKDIVRVLKMDPAICAKLLRTVNSCMYGLRNPVVSVERAVSIIGFHPLRSLVLGLAIPAMQTRPGSESGLRSFWRESVSGAIMARELAIRFKDPHAEEVFLCGLLRDLGMTILEQRYGSRYDPVWSVGNQQWNELWGKSQCQWEQEHLGIDHTVLSAGLLGRWRLPEEIVQPVRYHHAPEQAAGLNHRVHERAKLLDFCSRMARIENVAEDAAALQEVLRIAEEQYRLPIAELEQFLSEVCPKIDAFAEILNVDIGTSANFAQVMSAGCAELARLSLELSLGHPAQFDQPLPGDTQMTNLQNASREVGGAAGAKPYSLDFIDRLEEPGFRYSIQGYEIEELLGRGGMGVVLKAYEPGLDRSVALKMITPQLASHPRIRDRFLQESRTAAAILHENVVTIFTIGKHQGVSFLVMEYVDGRSIQDHHRLGRRFQAREIARIGKECALGLAAAHKLGIIHRDIKPGNILLRREGERAQLTDFGLACVLRDDYEQASPDSVWGTPEYMSPEQCEGTAIDFASDLYSLGGTLFALATGMHPFPWTVRRERETVPVDRTIRQFNPTIPTELAQLIGRLQSPSPRDRFASAEETARALAAVEQRIR